MPQSLPTNIATQFAWAPIEAWASSTASAADYAARAVALDSSPTAHGRGLGGVARVATLRERPTWAHRTRAESGRGPVARLLDYWHPAHRAVPTLVLPPQAGHASSIVDYGHDQSQMMTLRDAGLDRLFAIDWCRDDQTADLVDRGVRRCAARDCGVARWRVNLVGDCQGGVAGGGSTPAVHPDQVQQRLTIGGRRLTRMSASRQFRTWTAHAMPRRTERRRCTGRLVLAGGGVQRVEHQLTRIQAPGTGCRDSNA